MGPDHPRSLKRGFSLVEGLVSLLVLSFAMMVAASLFSTYGRVHRHTRERDRIMLAASVAMQDLGLAVAGAAAVDSPGLGVRGSRLALSRLVLDEATRFPATPPGSWDPQAPLREVVFELEEDRLVRREQGRSEVLVDGVSRFEVERSLEDDFTLVVELGQGAVLETSASRRVRR